MTRIGLLVSALSSLAIVVVLTLVPTEGISEPEAPVRVAAAAEDPWQGPFEIEKATFFYDRFETFDSRDGLPSDKVTAVLVAGEDLWVGTDRGLARRRDGSWTTWRRADGLAHDYITSLALDTDTGDLWISTLGGLSVLSGGSFRSFSQLDSGLMNDVVYQVMVQGRTVWAATAAGASRLDLRTGSWQLFDHEN